MPCVRTPPSTRASPKRFCPCKNGYVKAPDAQPVKIPEPAPLFAAQPVKIPEPAPLFAAQPVKIPGPAPLFAAQPTKVFRRGLFSKRPESFSPRPFFKKA
ncbi:hypothetical protein D3Z39_03230 [Anaerotruncus colihominis]|uniref:Uncharacterized protein n=1 Tax=Anaerotruncus colihominis TaxID=169435 RepID=A0A845REY3_9FIRM|nr:hypothetical protein [Anaerotruncus colihominis]